MLHRPVEVTPRKRPFGYYHCEGPLVTDTVEKLRFTTAENFIGIFRMPGARTTDQLCASEVHQAGFSSDFYYPLVPRVQNDAYIANEIATDFKTEFFNSIGQ